MFPPPRFVPINSKSSAPIKSNFPWILSGCLICGQAEQRLVSPCLKNPIYFTYFEIFRNFFVGVSLLPAFFHELKCRRQALNSPRDFPRAPMGIQVPREFSHPAKLLLYPLKMILDHTQGVPRSGHLCLVAVGGMPSTPPFFQGFGRSMEVLEGNNSGARAPSQQDRNGKDLIPALFIPEPQSHIHRDIPAWDAGTGSPSGY